MKIGSHRFLKDNNLKIGDILWGCAYDYTSTKEHKGLHQIPILGMLSYTKYADCMDKYNDPNVYSPKYFIPFKKNAKTLSPENLAYSKAVYVEARQYATTELDSRHLYNELIQDNIDWHEQEIQKLKDDMLK